MKEITKAVSEQLAALEAEHGARLEAVAVVALIRPESEGETEARLHYVGRAGHQNRLGWLPTTVVTVPPPEPETGR